MLPKTSTKNAVDDFLFVEHGSSFPHDYPEFDYSTEMEFLHDNPESRKLIGEVVRNFFVKFFGPHLTCNDDLLYMDHR
jgi:hypothetical protein